MVTVIEGGMPNGMDLVMGKDERLNPHSRVNSGQRLAILEIGNGNAISAQVQILPQFDETRENVSFFLTCLGGPASDIVGFQPRPMLLAELGKIPIADLQAKIAEMFAPPKVDEA